MYITTTIPYVNARPHLGFAFPDLEVAPLVPDVDERVHAALEDFDFRAAASAVWSIVEEANRYIEREQPWKQADPDVALATLVHACRALAVHLEDLLPGAAARVAAQVAGERLPAPAPLFPRIV